MDLECYSAIKKRNEALIHATTEMDHENTVLSERIQAHKNHVLCDSIYTKWL